MSLYKTAFKTVLKMQINKITLSSAKKNSARKAIKVVLNSFMQNENEINSCIYDMQKNCRMFTAYDVYYAIVKRYGATKTNEMCKTTDKHILRYEHKKCALIHIRLYDIKFAQPNSEIAHYINAHYKNIL